MDYQLELKQIVDYPRCRIYREFLRSLMEDRDTLLLCQLPLLLPPDRGYLLSGRSRRVDL